MCDHNHTSPSEQKEIVMVKNYLTADQAINLTKSTQKPLSILFKRIKEEAEYGINRIEHYVDYYAPVIVENMIKTLKDAGYTVTEETNENDQTVLLVITWPIA